jgi:hypothetical protein
MALSLKFTDIPSSNYTGTDQHWSVSRQDEAAEKPCQSQNSFHLTRKLAIFLIRQVLVDNEVYYCRSRRYLLILIFIILPIALAIFPKSYPTHKTPGSERTIYLDKITLSQVETVTPTEWLPRALPSVLAFEGEWIESVFSNVAISTSSIMCS